MQIKNVYICEIFNNRQFIMELSHIEHIGIAVNNLEEAIAYYENTLGLDCYAIEEVSDQKVKTAFFKIGQTKITRVILLVPQGQKRHIL